jgi:serine/threonine protein kinase
MTDATRSHDATHSQGPVDSTRPASDVDNSKAQALSAGFPQVPGYSIEAKIGEGGMGAVYKAVQVKLNRVVALKMIHGGKTASTRELLRFIAEAEAVAAIDHPNVVKVHDTGDANGQLYIAMEYLPNGTLSEKLQKLSHGREPVVEPASNSAPSHRRLTPSAQLSPREVAELMVKLANAVQAAHDRQIVHRDLKPSNIMFDAHDEPRITDFGLAKRQAGELTNTNAIMGTPAYMAPEQAKGESKFVGPQADVWALGVILYEALSGQRPFKGTGELEILNQVLTHEPSSIRSVSREVPKELDLIVQKCLAKEPADRYASAKSLAADLQNWLDGKPVSVKAAGSAERVIKWTKRNKLAAGILAGSLAAMLVFASLSIWAIGESRRADNREQEALRTAKESEEMKNAALDLGYRAEINLLMQRLANDLSGNRKTSLFIPEKQMLALKTGNRLDIIDLRDGKSRMTFDSVTGPFDVSRRDCRLAFTKDGIKIQLRSIDTQYSNRDRTIESPWFTISNLAISPNSEYLFASGNTGQIALFDTESGKSVWRFQGEGPVTSAVFSPHSNKLLVATGIKVRVYELPGGREISSFDGHRSRVVAAGFTIDGSAAITIDQDRICKAWDLATTRVVDPQQTLAGKSIVGSNLSLKYKEGVYGSVETTIRPTDVAE